MIKKIFVGVLLAGVFVLLVFGAVNRTFAKTADNEPLAINQNISAGTGGTYGGGDHHRDDDCGVNNSIEDGKVYGRGTGAGQGVNASDCESPMNGGGNAYDVSNGAWAGPSGAPGDGDGTGQANVEEWMTYSGVMESATTDVWVISLENGSLLELDGQVLRYLVEHGFTVSEGDELSLTGFYDGEDFEVGKIDSITTGESILVRDENGRPLWAGGRGGRWSE